MEPFAFKDEAIVEQWQQVVEILARTINVPSAIITRIEEPHVEVFRASKTPGNPYHTGQVAELANHYCEEVFRSGSHLLVPNAPDSPRWKNAPEIDYDMVSYLGFPIKWPDGRVFGTLCVLDHKENAYSKGYEDLLEQFSAMLGAHLQLFYQKKALEKQLEELKVLRGIIPICMKCKKVRNDDGYWEQVETYVHQRSHANFSHGVCPECAGVMYADMENEMAGEVE